MAYYDSIYQDTELGPWAKVVYIYLKDHANKDGTCWPGIKTIAEGVSLSCSTVKRALYDLATVAGKWKFVLEPLSSQISLRSLTITTITMRWIFSKSALFLHKCCKMDGQDF